MPPKQHEDLVALCRRNHLEPSTLQSCRTIKDFFPFLELISPGGLMIPQVRTCLCGGASLPDVDVRLESRLPGVPMETNGIPEDDDQELNAPTSDDAPTSDEDDEAPDWGSESGSDMG